MLRLTRSRGFTLIEMAIVLLIAGLLVAGVTQILTSAQKNRGDQAVANEVKTVISALERFTVDQQATLATQITTSGSAAALLNLTGSASLASFATNYLPAGLQCTVDPAISGCLAGTSPYTIGIARQDINQTTTGTGRPSFRALILRQPDNTLDDTRLGRVASLIGTQGGLVSNTALSPFPANGVMGSWSVTNPPVQYGVTPPSAGMIAALTNTVDAQISVNNLSRIGAAGQNQWSEANTMRNDLFMGSGGNANYGSATDAWAIHNASGVGYVLAATIADAQLGNSCGNSAQINIVATDGTTALGSLKVDNYMTVVGFNNATPTPNRVLLQCLPTISNGFQWQVVGGQSTTLNYYCYDSTSPNYSQTGPGIYATPICVNAGGSQGYCPAGYTQTSSLGAWGSCHSHSDANRDYPLLPGGNCGDPWPIGNAYVCSK